MVLGVVLVPADLSQLLRPKKSLAQKTPAVQIGFHGSWRARGFVFPRLSGRGGWVEEVSIVNKAFVAFCGHAAWILVFLSLSL